MPASDDRSLVDDAMRAALAAAAAPGGAPLPPMPEFHEPLMSLASSGKRLRAKLLLTAYRACGGSDEWRAIRLASALELFQVAALVHDDVLDHADTRRGLPAVHKAIEAAHRAGTWQADATEFGVGGAVLAGDLALMACMAEAMQAAAGLDAASAARVARTFGDLTQLCTIGQYLDLRLAVAAPQPAELTGQVEAVMRAKTASYTTVAPLALGAALAGADDAALDAWARAAEPLGLAFQLRDDLLGTVGDAERTGKPAGGDIIEGKRTLLAAHVLERGSQAEREAFAAAWGVQDAKDALVAAAIDALRSSGAVAAAERRIALWVAEGRAALASIAMEDQARASLDALVDALVGRDF